MSTMPYKIDTNSFNPTRKKTILVIDDDPTTLNLLVNRLSNAGFSPVTTKNSAEALTLLRNQSFDLILTDLVMPEIDGFQVLSTVTHEDPELPVIIISGQAGINESIKALRLGAWDFVTKPIDVALLIHQINKALERAALLKENTNYRHKLKAEVEARTAELYKRTQELEDSNNALRHEIQTRLQIEQELTNANKRWQITFDSMPDFISIHDRDFTILHANQALIDFLGKSPEEIIGAKCCQIFHSSCTPWTTCPHRELLATGRSHTSEVNDPHLGIPLLVTVVPIRREGEIIGSIHIAKDISHQKTLEEERQKNINLESIASLCGGLAHDFNNLLTALGGYIDLASMEKRPERLTQWLGQAKMVTNLTTELTSQLLTFSKGGTPILKYISVPMLIHGNIDRFSKTLPNVKTNVNIDDDIWPISGDNEQLRTVLRNLFYNAAEAMPKGGTLTIEAHNVPEEYNCTPLNQDSVLITLRDEGIGISPQIIDRIFDPYFTTSSKGSTKGKGLGLALCHSIIRKHHGHIAVSSTENHGTTVSIYLPAIVAPTA
ncbi:MAG: response regulator [Desulfobulbaceae bacterium]|nr:response regulator [Desulfobulbaceae bacterium]